MSIYEFIIWKHDNISFWIQRIKQVVKDVLSTTRKALLTTTWIISAITLISKTFTVWICVRLCVSLHHNIISIGITQLQGSSLLLNPQTSFPLAFQHSQYLNIQLILAKKHYHSQFGNKFSVALFVFQHLINKVVVDFQCETNVMFWLTKYVL